MLGEVGSHVLVGFEKPQSEDDQRRVRFSVKLQRQNNSVHISPAKARRLTSAPTTGDTAGADQGGTVALQWEFTPRGGRPRDCGARGFDFSGGTLARRVMAFLFLFCRRALVAFVAFLLWRRYRLRL